jgi:hypothetical protein
MNFSFNCISCGQSTFAVDSEAIMYGGVPVATFVCPKCNEHNAVQVRSGGGLVVSADLQGKAKSSQSSGKA